MQIAPSCCARDDHASEVPQESPLITVDVDIFPTSGHQQRHLIYITLCLENCQVLSYRLRQLACVSGPVQRSVTDAQPHAVIQILGLSTLISGTSHNIPSAGRNSCWKSQEDITSFTCPTHPSGFLRQWTFLRCAARSLKPVFAMPRQSAQRETINCYLFKALQDRSKR